MGKQRHIVLDGTEYILTKGRNTMPHRRQPVIPWASKRGAGDTRYSDLTVWSERAWTDTHLGRGEEFDNGLDGRYFDAEQLCTRYKGWVTLGYAPSWLFARTTVTGKAIQEGYRYHKGLPSPLALLGKPEWYWAIGQSFKPPSKISCSRVTVWMGWTGRGEGLALQTVTAKICQDDNNKPGAAICSKAIGGAAFKKEYGISKTYKVDFAWAGPATLYKDTKYWLVLETNDFRENVWHRVLFDDKGGYADGAWKYQGKEGGPWKSEEHDLYFTYHGNIIEPGGPLISELDGLVTDFCMFDALDGGGPKLHVLAGKEVYVYKPDTERLIEDDAGLSGTGICMRVYKDSLYVSQGVAGEVRVKTGSGWGNAGWKARYMGVAPDLEGAWALWVQVAIAKSTHKVRSTVDGTDFSDVIECGEQRIPITFIGWYAGQVWVGKEDEIGSIDRATRAYSPQFQFPSQREADNFKAACVWHKNDLMLNIIYSVWHYNMGSQFRNIGPSKGIGFPKDRRGKTRAMLPLVNRLLVAIDGRSRYSSIVSYGGVGDVSWHEEYRADRKGERIIAMFYTPAGEVEENARLWFGCGKRVGYLVMPDDTDNPVEWEEEAAKFYMQGTIIYPWFDGFLRGVDKDWDDVTIEVYRITDDTFVDVLYRTAQSSNVWSEGGWEELGTIGSEDNVEKKRADVSPVKRQATLSFPPKTATKLIQIALILRTKKSDQTPIVQMAKLKWWPEPDRVNRWTLNLNCIGWENIDGVKQRWEKQQKSLWASYYKKEPVLFTDVFGKEWRVRFDTPPIELPIPAGQTDQPRGCEYSVQLVEV